MPNANWHALAGFAAGANTAVKLGIIPNHGDFGHRVRAVADQRRPFERRADFPVFDLVGFRAGKDELARSDVDLPAAEPARVAEQIEDVIGIDASDAVLISAKTGLGIPDVLEAIVTRLPAPGGDRDAPLKAMLVDSYYDSYLGVVVIIRVIDGVIKKGDRIRMLGTGGRYPVDRLGVFKPKMTDIKELGPGEIGFLTASIKQVRDTRVGDTITHEKGGTDKALPGFKPAQPVVFCGLFPVDSAEFEDLRDAIEKLALNDASFSFEMETSAALGFGFRCGFLGLLHLEVIRDRIEREYDIDLITTAPSVIYHVHMKDVWWSDKATEAGIFGGHTEFGDQRRHWDFRSLGRGSIDFEEIIRALNRVGYNGPLSVEWEDIGMDREHGAAEACEFVKSIDFEPSNVAFDAAFSDD